jgi:hypothetical protein
MNFKDWPIYWSSNLYTLHHSIIYIFTNMVTLAHCEEMKISFPLSSFEIKSLVMLVLYIKENNKLNHPSCDKKLESSSKTKNILLCRKHQVNYLVAF